MKVKKITIICFAIIGLLGAAVLLINLSNPCLAYAKQPVQDVPRQCLEVMLR